VKGRLAGQALMDSPVDKRKAKYGEEGQADYLNDRK